MDTQENYYRDYEDEKFVLMQREYITKWSKEMGEPIPMHPYDRAKEGALSPGSGLFKYIKENSAHKNLFCYMGAQGDGGHAVGIVVANNGIAYFDPNNGFWLFPNLGTFESFLIEETTLGGLSNYAKTISMQSFVA
jgi:hypothetical protein